MENSRKKLIIVAMMSEVTILATVIAITGLLPTANLSYSKATGPEYSISFVRADSTTAVNTTYTYKTSTTNGNDVYLVSTGGNARTSGYLATIPSMYDSSVAAVSMKFYKDSDTSRLFRHQLISSVTVTTSGSVTLSIQTSMDGITYREKGILNCTSSGASLEGFDQYDRFLLITESSRANAARSIKQVDIAYECESAFESAPASVYTAIVKDNTNQDAPMSLHLNSDHYGYYQFHYNGDGNEYYTLFTWTYDDDLRAVKLDYTATPAGSISDKEGTGNSTNYSGYRLFGRFTAGWGNYAAVFEDSVSIYFHTSQATASNPNQYQRAEANKLVKAS